MLLSRIVKASSSTPSLSSLHRHLLLPRDIHYDDEIRRVLTVIREAKATTPAAASTAETHTGERSYVESKIITAALSSLTSAGIINDFGVTLTLVGYKGGELDQQINQDRAFVLSPFYDMGDGGQPSELANYADSDQRGDEKDGLRLRNNNKNNRLGRKMQLMGVMDGHDRLGEVVSEYAMRELPSILSSKLNEFEKDRESPLSSSSSEEEFQDVLVQKALTEAFLHINATIPTKGSGGCTASVLLRIDNKAYIANVGDSRTFIVVYHEDTKHVRIVYQTREDKPHLDAEKARIEQMGGEVYIPSKEMMESGQDSSRTVIMDQDTGFQSSLAMSRSLGDWDFSSAGVIALPTVEVLNLDQFVRRDPMSDKVECDEATTDAMKETCLSEVNSPKIFSVAASDGLLDFISPDELATTLAHSLYDEEGQKPHPVTASEQLILKAADAWQKEMGHEYRDDIVLSVMKII